MGVIAAYPYHLENPLDLREHGLEFMIAPKETENGSEVLEPLKQSEDLGTALRLRFFVKTIRRTMRIGNIAFEKDIECRLVYRPYWEVSFKTRPDKDDTRQALVCLDEILLTAKS
jgi:hypothetical protein